MKWRSYNLFFIKRIWKVHAPQTCEKNKIAHCKLWKKKASLWNNSHRCFKAKNTLTNILTDLYAKFTTDMQRRSRFFHCSHTHCNWKLNTTQYHLRCIIQFWKMVRHKAQDDSTNTLLPIDQACHEQKRTIWHNQQIKKCMTFTKLLKAARNCLGYAVEM